MFRRGAKHSTVATFLLKLVAHQQVCIDEFAMGKCYVLVCMMAFVRFYFDKASSKTVVNYCQLAKHGKHIYPLQANKY